MHSTATAPRVTTGPFEMEGVEWIQYGHVGLVRDLKTARAAAAKLLELGFSVSYTEEVGRGGVFYSFAFVGSYDIPTHHFECITITVIAVDYTDRPQVEIVYLNQAGRFVRFGAQTYDSTTDVNSLHLIEAYNLYGRRRVHIRPTLWP